MLDRGSKTHYQSEAGDRDTSSFTPTYLSKQSFEVFLMKTMMDVEKSASISQRYHYDTEVVFGAAEMEISLLQRATTELPWKRSGTTVDQFSGSSVDSA